MQENQYSSDSRPLGLLVIAILFLLSGIHSAASMVFALFAHKISIEFGVLGIPICFGLLYYKNGWRILALIMIAFGIVGSFIAAGFALLTQKPADFTVFGQDFGKISANLAALFIIPFIMFFFWEFWYLVKPDISARFRH